jgi:hypothetical protein
MKHLTAEELGALHDGALPPARREAAEQHLAACDDCREELAALVAQDALLARASEHDPGDAYFERFAGRVADRIRPAAGPAPAAWWDRLLAPRALALVGSAAAVIAVAGLVWMQSRERGTAALRNPEVMQYDRAAEPAPVVPEPAAPGEAASEAAPEVGPGPAVRELAAGRAGAANEAMGRQATVREGKARAEVAQSPAAVGGAAAGSRLEGREKQALPVRDARSGEGAVHTRGAGEAGVQEVRRAPDGEVVPVRERVLPGTSAAPPPDAAAPAPGGTTVRRSLTRSLPDRAPPAVAPQALTQREEDTMKSARDALGAAPGVVAVARVCGAVLDAAGRPVAGARVTVAETGAGTVTGADGRYCVEAPAGAGTLSVLALGFRPARRAIDAAGRSPSGKDFRLEAVSVLPGGADARLPRVALDTAVPAPWPEAALALVARADSLTSAAGSEGGALRYEAAVAAWAAVALATRGHASEPRALSHVAELRYRTWKSEPTPARKAAALAATRAYLEAAPRAPADDPARGWLRELAR